MAEAVLMLALSPTMDEGTIMRWHKKEGETVAHGDLLCEVETDKAAMEYESVNQGTLLAILVPAGGSARVGEPIAVVGKPGEDIHAFRTASAAPAAPAAEAAAPAPAVPAAPTSVPAAPRGPSAAESQPPSGARRLRASPLARRLARKRGLDLGRLAGSGPGGRVVARDLPAADAASVQKAAGPAAAPAEDRRLPVTGKRKLIAQRLSESKQAAPHYYLQIEVDATRFLEFRERLGKPSVNALLMKLTAEALKRHPLLNSSWQGDHILVPARADIGLAVAQEDGLITPVVRDCGGKTAAVIERELADLIPRARANRLTPQEYAGATFTVTNLGSFGILSFSAIINPPGSAILAVGRIRRVPVVLEGDRVAVRPELILTLSCDHRVVDGAVGAAFLKDLKGVIEDPLDALYTLKE